MSWATATPSLVIGGLFDLFRYAFLFFWLWGPAVIGYGVSSYYGGGIEGHIAGAVAGLAGYTATPVLAAFGTVMSITMAISGWFLVLIFILMIDTHIITKHPTGILWLLEGIMGSTFLMAFFMFRAQIRKERETLKQWERTSAAAREAREAAQLAKAARLRAANDNQTEEIPGAPAEAA